MALLGRIEERSLDCFTAMCFCDSFTLRKIGIPSEFWCFGVLRALFKAFHTLQFLQNSTCIQYFAKPVRLHSQVLLT